MLASVFILVTSVFLLVYWLRSSCSLLVRSAREHAGLCEIGDERFSVASVLERLKNGGELDQLERELERDFRVVTYLIEHAAGLALASSDNRLLILNYKLMRMWSHQTRRIAPSQSRRALAEMANVLSVLVSQMGETGVQLEA